MERWPVKILSVVGAIFLVVFHMMNEREIRFFSAPLNVTENGNLIPASAMPPTVRISLHGDAGAIYPIIEDDIEAYLDLTRYTAKGTYRIPVQVRKKGAALEAESIEIKVDPPEVSLDLDQKASKYVGPIASLQGNVAAGYTLVSETFNPAQLLIDGPAGLLDNITGIYTKEIDINGRTGDFTQSVGVRITNPLVTLHGEGIVEFRGIIRPNIITKSFDRNIAITSLREEFFAETETKSGKLWFEGPESRLERWAPDNSAGLIVDCAQIADEGTYTLPLTVIPPINGGGDINLNRYEPEEAVIIVTRR
jgi:YbbR domain-containing protein